MKWTLLSEEWPDLAEGVLAVWCCNLTDGEVFFAEVDMTQGYDPFLRTVTGNIYIDNDWSHIAWTPAPPPPDPPEELLQ